MLLTLHGTGAGVPSADRSASALSATFADGSVVLFDAGEGCSRPMLRDGVDLDRITTVAISHLHPDHWLGLPNLVIVWAVNRRPGSVRILVPPGSEQLVRDILLRSYIFPEWLTTRLDVQALSAFDMPDGWRATPFATTHLAPYLELSRRYGNPPEAFGYLLQNGERRVVLSQDIGSVVDLEPHVAGAELLVCEAAHIDPLRVLELAADLSVARVVFTHVPPVVSFPATFAGVRWSVASEGERIEL